MVKKQSKKRVPGYRKVEVRDPVFFGHLIVLGRPLGQVCWVSVPQIPRAGSTHPR